jgi:CHASE3 domain sensor protein
MTQLENKEIKGVSITTIKTIVTSTAFIVGAFYWGISKIDNNINDVQKSLDKAMYESNTRIRTLEVRLDAVELLLQELKHRNQP